ncbi:MAG: RecX family transcriptional regulator [Pseudomonadota bacterium]
MPPLEPAALERLALRYVERFATTRAKLVRYLGDKVRARGWADGPAPEAAALAEKLAALGYIDDRAFAAARAGVMTRRGLGARRVRGALRQAGVEEDDAASVEPALDAGKVDAALAFARRKRIGPYAAVPADRMLREKQIGAMIRGGHPFALARIIADLAPGDDPEAALAQLG